MTFDIGIIRYPNKLFSNPCIPGQLILDKDVKIIQKGNNFSTDTLETHAQKNWGGVPYLTTNTKVKLQGTKDVKVKAKTVKYFLKIQLANIHDIRLGNSSWKMTPKHKLK